MFCSTLLRCTLYCKIEGTKHVRPFAKNCFSTSFFDPQDRKSAPLGGPRGSCQLPFGPSEASGDSKKNSGRWSLGESLTFTSVCRGSIFRKGPFGGSFRPRKWASNCKIRWEIDVASRNTRKTHRLCDVAFEK